MIREIKVYSTVGKSGTIKTDVTTLGELLPLLEGENISYSGMKMLVGDTRNELSVDEAVLPEGDFKLYLMPAKTKSGLDVDAEDLEEVLETLESTVATVKGILNIAQEAEKESSESYEDSEALKDIRSLAEGKGGTQW